MPLPNQDEPGPRGGSGQMFDQIADRYDLLNRLMSFGLDARWRRRLVERMDLPPRAHVLDVACGTADVGLAIVAKHPDARVVGIDPSGNMLEHGARKLIARGLDAQIKLLPGDALDLPFAAQTFDAACIAFGIRNVVDRPAALRQMVRVVRPGRPVVVLELAEPRVGPLQKLARWHVHHLAPVLGAWLSGADAYRYLARSIAAFPPPEAFAQIMAEAGLCDLQVQPLGFGALHLYRGLRAVSPQG